MHAHEVKCPGCFAPVVPAPGLTRCRYCGATIAIQAAAPLMPELAAPRVHDVTAPVFLDDCGSNKIEVIKVVREYTGLGLREAKELVERAPCVVAHWPTEALKMQAFRGELVRAGARVR